MAKLSSITRPIERQLPKASNLTGAAITGIGAYRVGRFLDGLIGNRIQSIGIPLPFIGQLSVLDALMIASFKAAFRKNSMVAAAFVGDRVFNIGQSLTSMIPGMGTSQGIAPASAPGTSTAVQGGGF
jgi:hypothetical protein